MASFGAALDTLRAGRKAHRKEWQGAWLELRVPDAHSKMTVPYIYFSTPNAKMPWVPSHTDMLAHDWVLSVFNLGE